MAFVNSELIARKTHPSKRLLTLFLRTGTGNEARHLLYILVRMQLRFPKSWTAFALACMACAPHALASTEIGAFVGNPDHRAPTATEVNDFENQIGREVSSVLVYWAWNDGDFPTQQLMDGVRFHDGYDTHTTLQLTWEPWSRNGGDDQSYSLEGIINGDFDAYITKFAQDCKAWGDTMRIRFAHEMIQDNNPNTPGFYPWQDRPAVYVSAFDHIYNIFQNQGATNVEWAWTPNNFPFDLNTLKLYYPGADKITWVGVDGYNAGEDGLPGYPYWQNFDDLFFNMYHALIDNKDFFGDKKFMIGEFASTEGNSFDPRDKPEWIMQAFARMKEAYPEIAAFYWFNKLKEGDWRVDSSPDSLEEFQSAMLDPYFTSHAVPEPGTFSLLAGGLAAMLLYLRMRRS